MPHRKKRQNRSALACRLLSGWIPVLSNGIVLSGSRRKPAHCSYALGPSFGTFSSSFLVENFPFSSRYFRMAEQIGVGVPTLEDMIKELEKPGRDPRDEAPAPVLRSDVLSMEDLQEGMVPVRFSNNTIYITFLEKIKAENLGALPLKLFMVLYPFHGK